MKPSQPYDLIIIGAGPAGLSAACAALKSAPLRVLILEKEEKAARKILASGNGRCNFSHRESRPDAYFSQSPDLLRNLFRGLPSDLENVFLKDYGIPAFSDPEGRLYPLSEESSAVHQRLLSLSKDLGAELQLGAEVKNLSEYGGFWRAGLADGSVYEGRSVLLSCGGRAAPQLGGSPSAERFASQLHLDYFKEAPALTPLILKESEISKMASGGRFKGEVRLGGTAVSGEFLFTDYGISGIAAMDLSTQLYDELLLEPQGDKVPLGEEKALEIDFFPGCSRQQLSRLLRECMKSLPGQDEKSLLAAFMKERIARAFCLTLPKSLSTAELCYRLKHWTLHLVALRSFPYAQITRGGIALSELNGDFSLRRRPSCFVAGEALDVAGLCGGYNLHWAFSSGRAAGLAAAHYLASSEEASARRSPN